jgi:hypothetical protein
MVEVRGRILDGPAAGHETRTFAFGRWAPILCWRSGLESFEHHLHVGGGQYRHVGPCIDHHESGDMPGDWDPGCPEVVDKRVDNPSS